MGSRLPTRVWLVGLSGAGKSTVGPRLANKLAYEFIDLDARIEERAGATIAELFSNQGERRFRDLEAVVSREAASRLHVVVATGGGWMSRSDIERAWPGCVRVWLRVDPETAIHRLSESEEDRPLLAGEDPLSSLTGLLDRRRGAYAEAEIVVDTDGRDPGEVVSAIVEQIRAWGLSPASTQESEKNS